MRSNLKARLEKMERRGRPTEFSGDVAQVICAEIAAGGTLKSAAEKAKVSDETIKRWLRSDDDFRAQYAQAREDQADAFADSILETALNGELEPNDRRVRVDALKWLAGKRKPKVYGEKVTTELAGEITVTTKEQRDAAVAAAIRADR